MAQWKLRSWLKVVALALYAGMSGWAVGQTHPPVSGAGEEIYNKQCAACHEHPDATRAPAKSALNAMTGAAIRYALTQGNMKVQGSNLTPDQRQAGLTKAQMSHLELAWAIAIPGGATMRTQPAIVGNTVFLPVADARAVYAFDVSQPRNPCVKWVYKTGSESPLRSSASYGVLADGRGALAFSAFDTTVYLLDAETGKPIWTKHAGTYLYSQATGTPVVLKDRVLVPMSQYEIVVAAPNARSCCNEHGYVLSLDPRDGSQQWRYDTMPDAKPIRDRGDGKMLYGPSGAPIWASPAVDEARGLVFIGTGESNSPPVSKNTDAMIAVNLADGKERWSLQGTDKDIYLSGCGPHPRPDQLNCEKDTVYRDVDFGASMVLAPAANGTETMYGGQKSGTVWSVDAATGKLLWRNDLGSGSPLGGIHWGIALANNTVYAPITAVSDWYLNSFLPKPLAPSAFKSGMYALDAKTGKVRWVFPVEADWKGDRIKRIPTCAGDYGMSAAPAVIDGAVVEGTLDGYLYVLDGENGNLLWKFDTAIDYQGINGVAGKGGAIDSAAISAADGVLFVNSGYNMFGQTPGNVFLAFRVKGK